MQNKKNKIFDMVKNWHPQVLILSLMSNIGHNSHVIIDVSCILLMYHVGKHTELTKHLINLKMAWLCGDGSCANDNGKREQAQRAITLKKSLMYPPNPNNFC